MKKVLLIINTKASQGEKNLAQAREILLGLGCEVIVGEPRDGADYTAVIRAHQGRVDVVVVGGGDGTVQCAAQGILETKLPLGILPLGTANNVARSLDLPLTLEGACEVVVNGKLRPMDLAKVNGRLFVSVVGIGFSTEVHTHVPSEQKKAWGSLAYFFQALKLAWTARKSFIAEIKGDREQVRVRALQVTVCNGRFYGAHVEIHKEASISDGMLDISIIKEKNFFIGWLKTLIPTETAHRSPGLQLLHSKRFEINTYPPKVIDVEGMTDLRTPATFEVLPKPIQVLTPTT